MRILLAEDEKTIAKALQVMLEKNKYAVDLVHNGLDARDYILSGAYDAIAPAARRTAKPCGRYSKTIKLT